jgi:hypothetical protein
MFRRTSALISCLLIASSAALAATGTAGATPRVPMGVYARISLDSIYKNAMTVVGSDTSAAELSPRRSPDATLAPLDATVVNYITALLDNPAVSGIAAESSWGLLNPGNPGPDLSDPAPGSYNWGPLDDLFIAVNQWNTANADLPPKTIQFLLIPGFASPGWVLSDIDDSVCGTGIKPVSCTGSCDGLFMTPYPSPIVPAVSNKCGYTTIFYRVEADPIEQLPLPLPWNAVYKNDWKAFLTAFNKQVLEQPSHTAFVSIAVAGPTASSTEMILPSSDNQKPGLNSAGLLALKTGKKGVVPPGEKPVGFAVPDAWNALLHNFYAPDADYQNSDLAFLDEWNDAIDAYGKIFSGITLILTTSTDALPDFPANTDESLLVPALGFGSDCDDGPLASIRAMNCSAVTQVLAHFTRPSVGGKNAKSTQENGMTASRDGSDLGTNAVKWLAMISASGKAVLPGTSDSIPRILGGMQFSTLFSDSTFNSRLGGSPLQAEGCPTFPKPLCKGLMPSKGLDNVQKLSFFPGTPAGPVWDASLSVDYSHWIYSYAPMNYTQIYDSDILYGSGLSGCPFENITGNPAMGIPPDVSTCSAQPHTALLRDAQTTQEELELTNQILLFLAEPATP